MAAAGVHGCHTAPHLHPTSPAGIFNGVKLVVETPEDTLFSHRGANVTLPCRYHYEPAPLSPRPVRIKWWKLSENGAPEQDVLVAIGLRHRSFGDYRGRVRLRRDGEREVSLQIRDLRLEDYGRYRCEVIDGLEDESGLVDLELRGEALRNCLELCVRRARSPQGSPSCYHHSRVTDEETEARGGGCQVTSLGSHSSWMAV